MKKISALPNSNADGVGGFTYGSVKDVTAPASFDGTPFRADWQNDIQSFHQRLLTEASIVPSGASDTPATSQLFDALSTLTGSLLGADVTVTVGGAGDYATINAALEAITRLYTPVYKAAGVTVTINLLAGFVMGEQVIVDGLNLGYVKITGADASTTITRSALSSALTVRVGTSGALNYFPAFAVINGGTLPMIDQLFSMDTSGTATDRVGIMAYGAGSSANITSGAGVNSGYINIFALGEASIYAYGVKAETSITVGLHAADNATIHAAAGSAINSAGTGVYAYSGGEINFMGGSATGATTYGGLAAGNARINGASAFFQKGGAPATSDLVIGSGSSINASGTTCGLGKVSGGAATANTVYADGIIYK